ncbi:MAG: nucleotidyltransferase domain-containing protein [Anaerolineales bacterium]|nr:nucleotidyltransferase domain-containing protein [Anaerolineales bacterium]
MVDNAMLAEAVRRIVSVSQPTRIILFGSHAREQADSGSDLDLMVIQPEVANPYAEMLRLHEALGNIGPGIDVLVYSEAEFQRRSRVPGTVLYWARKEGKSLYAAAS